MHHKQAQLLLPEHIWVHSYCTKFITDPIVRSTMFEHIVASCITVQALAAAIAPLAGLQVYKSFASSTNRQKCAFFSHVLEADVWTLRLTCSAPLDERAAKDPKGGPLRLLPYLPQSSSKEALQDTQG